MKKNFKHWVVRVVRADMASRGGFRYPRPGVDIGHGPGVVVAPDWDPEPKCGHGLHGWLGGAGDPSIASCVGVDDPEAVWLILGIDDHVELDRKVKFERGVVLHAGKRDEIHTILVQEGRNAPGANFVQLTGGDYATLTGGDYATLTGGDYATLTGGDHATLTGGNHATLTGGDHATLTWRLWGGARYRLHVFYVGENGVEPSVAYKLSDKHELVRL